MGGMPPGGAPAAVAGGPPTGPGPSAGGAPFPGPTGDISGGGGDVGSDYSSMLSDLRKADPNMLMNQLKRIKQIFAVLLVNYLEPLPNVAGKISKVIPHIDAIIKEAERASSTSGAIRPGIQMGAASPRPTTGGAATGIGPGAMGSVGPMGA